MPRILTILSHEKSQMTHALNEFLTIPHILHTKAYHIASNHIISYKSFNMKENDSTIDNFSQHNINTGIITRFKRGKNTQASCRKDDAKQRERIEDHQQAAESCEEPREWRSDGYQISTESYQKICNDLLSNREYHQSIESNSPICLNKPESYNNLQACESSDGSYKSKRSTQIISERWFRGKAATEGKIYYKYKPKPCSYLASQEKTECFHELTKPSQDCCKDKPNEVTKYKSEQIATYPTQQCAESELTSSKKIILEPKEISPVEVNIPKEYARDTHEYYIKPDSPPPRPQHWSENPPAYCNHCSKETCLSPVKASPAISIPEKGPWRSQAKDTTSSSQNIHEDSSRSPNENECSRSDAKASHLQKNVSKKCMISFEDKCAASLTVPVNKTMESKIQQFPRLTKDGGCCVDKPEKKPATLDVNDCSSNMTSFKYRLSKCPSIKEMRSIGVKREPPVDVSMQQKQEALLSYRRKKKRSKSRPETARKEKKRIFKSRAPGNGWARQKYKVRLKNFQKGNGRLDPCLPQIVELKYPRDKRITSKQLKSTVHKSEFSSENSSPHYPSETLIAKTKSYVTKMEESRVIRDQYVGKHPSKKHR